MNTDIDNCEQFGLLFIIFTIVLNIHTIISTNFKSLFEQGTNLKKYFFVLELLKYCFSAMVNIYK